MKNNYPPPQPSPVSLHFDRKPSNIHALLKSLLARRRAQPTAGQCKIQFQATWNGARAAPRELRSYISLCRGSDPGNSICAPVAPGPYFTFTLPPLYLHAMAMPLHMAVLTHPQFPLRLPGMLHWSNQTEMLAPIAPGDPLDFECRMDGINTTERGSVFDLHTLVRIRGVLVWREISTFLSPLSRTKSGGPNAKPANEQSSSAQRGDEPVWGAPQAHWDVAADAGRRFAGPSGDWNPIHVSAASARLFGYPRAIAHGMFSAARCLEKLIEKKPVCYPVRLDVRFRRPLLIPGKVALHTVQRDGATLFVLRMQPSGQPHIEGRLQMG
jgi:acyl dehydratase